MLLSLHPNIIVHVEHVVSLFSSPSTSSQKVRKCGGHNFLSQAIECISAFTLHVHVILHALKLSSELQIREK